MWKGVKGGWRGRSVHGCAYPALKTDMQPHARTPKPFDESLGRIVSRIVCVPCVK